MKMKYTILTTILLFFALALLAQAASPVNWSYATRKKADKVYEVVLTATLPKPWHIYSQHTPKGGPVPTKITFKANPLLTLDGDAVEAGNLKTDHDENFGVDVKYFADKVEFVQTVKLKSPVKTNVTGTIEFMVCNDEKCLPPAKQPFDVKLQ
jgi:thiol:disulfide interchange protein DsbD